MNKKEIEELKRLLFQDRLTQYGKRMLVQYLEQKESILDRVTDKLKELNQKYKNEYKIVECLDLIDPNLTALQELSCITDDIAEILNILEGEKNNGRLL